MVQANLNILQKTYNVSAVRPDPDNSIRKDDRFNNMAITDYSGVYFCALQQPRDPFFVITDSNHHIETILESTNEVIRSVTSP